MSKLDFKYIIENNFNHELIYTAQNVKKTYDHYR